MASVTACTTRAGRCVVIRAVSMSKTPRPFASPSANLLHSLKKTTRAVVKSILWC